MLRRGRSELEYEDEGIESETHREDVVEYRYPKLRLRVYDDARRLWRRIKWYVLGALVIVVVYYFFGWWALGAFFMALPLWWLVVPRVAEKFMSYVSVFAVSLRDDRPNEVQVVQFPHERFRRAMIVDDSGEKAALGFPFESAVGFSYLVDDVRVEHTDRGEEFDVVVVNPVHKNIDFALRYVPEFLGLRKEFLVVSKENFALKAGVPIEVARRYLALLNQFNDLVSDSLFKLPAAVRKEDAELIRQIQAEIIELKEAIGLRKETDNRELLGETP